MAAGGEGGAMFGVALFHVGDAASETCASTAEGVQPSDAGAPDAHDGKAAGDVAPDEAGAVVIDRSRLAETRAVSARCVETVSNEAALEDGRGGCPTATTPEARRRPTTSDAPRAERYVWVRIAGAYAGLPASPLIPIGRPRGTPGGSGPGGSAGNHRSGDPVLIRSASLRR